MILVPGHPYAVTRRATCPKRNRYLELGIAAMAPEACHRVYKMLRLKVLAYPDGGGELSGGFGQGVPVGPSGITPGCYSRPEAGRVRFGEALMKEMLGA